MLLNPGWVFTVFIFIHILNSWKILTRWARRWDGPRQQDYSLCTRTRSADHNVHAHPPIPEQKSRHLMGDVVIIFWKRKCFRTIKIFCINPQWLFWVPTSLTRSCFLENAKRERKMSKKQACDHLNNRKRKRTIYSQNSQFTIWNIGFLTPIVRSIKKVGMLL